MLLVLVREAEARRIGAFVMIKEQKGEREAAKGSWCADVGL